MGNRLIVGDLHLTDNVKDEYRWGIFEWLKDQIYKNKVVSLYILGDLTDKKDRHSSVLVNRIVNVMEDLLESFYLEKIYILKGNHDYIIEDSPFFNFLNIIDGFHFINEITTEWSDLFLPHTKDLSSWDSIDFSKYKYVYLHDTVKGCLLPGGELKDRELEEGIEVDTFKDISCTFISGHIHKPQKMSNNFIYIGSPYPINFGDNFEGRCILIDSKENMNDLYYPTIRKLSLKIRNVSELKKHKLKKDDQIKIEVTLYRSEFHDYHDMKKEIKQYCEEKGVDLCSLTLKALEPKKKLKRNTSEDIVKFTNMSLSDVLDKYKVKESLGKEQYDVGLTIIKDYFG